MTLRERAAKVAQNKLEELFRDDVRRLILIELREPPDNVRLLGFAPGPFGAKTWLWAYEVTNWRTGDVETKGVWINRTHKLIRRYERPPT